MFATRRTTFTREPQAEREKSSEEFFNASTGSATRDGGDRHLDNRKEEFPEPNAFWITCVFLWFTRVAVFPSLFFAGGTCRASTHTLGWHDNEKRTERICHATTKKFRVDFCQFPGFYAANMPPPFSPVDFCQFFAKKKTERK